MSFGKPARVSQERKLHEICAKTFRSSGDWVTEIFQLTTKVLTRINTPPPPIPERNWARPGYTLRNQQLQQEHQRGQERQIREYPVINQQTCSDAPKIQFEHQKRVFSLTDAELSESFVKSARISEERKRQEIGAKTHFPPWRGPLILM